MKRLPALWLMGLGLFGGGLTCATTCTQETFSNSIGMKLVRIRAGVFTMGSESAAIPIAEDRVKGVDYDERPAHRVTISKPFYMSETEVTIERYRKFKADYPGYEDYAPYAAAISWHDATAFCEWLSEKEGKPYRLPTEAQWEYACRAGTTTEYSSGKSPPGPEKANTWGLKNMHTGVAEWCLDWHGLYPGEPQTDPLGPEHGWVKVVRGGGLDFFERHKPYYTRSANRAGVAPNFGPPLTTYKVTGASEPNEPSMVGSFSRLHKTRMLACHAIGFRVVMAPLPATEPSRFDKPALMRCVKQTAAVLRHGPDQDKPYYKVRRLFPHGLDLVKRGWEIGVERGVYPLHHNAALAACPNGDMLVFYYNRPADAGEREPMLSIVGARWRHGAEQWDPPTPWPDFLDANDEAPFLWNDNGVLWLFWGCPRMKEAPPFQWTSSNDNGASWSPIRLPVFETRVGSYSAQPITSAFRGADGTIYVGVDGAGAISELFASGNNGRTWIDTGGRTTGRHSAFVLLNEDTVLAYGGKNADIEGFMPKNVSTDFGRTWQVSKSPVSRLGGGQRPALIRLASGRLLYAGDLRHAGGPAEPFPPAGKLPKGYIDSGGYVGLSDDKGESWIVRKLSDGGLLDEDGNEADVRSVGYVAACQSADGLIHVVTTSELHITFNETWVRRGDCGGKTADPEQTEIIQNTVRDYREKHKNGRVKVEWSAGIGTDGRYLLHGTERWYYEDGRKQWHVEYEAGRKVGEEIFWSPDGTVRWKRQHHGDGTGTWTIYDREGTVRAQSVWRGKKLLLH